MHKNYLKLHRGLKITGQLLIEDSNHQEMIRHLLVFIQGNSCGNVPAFRSEHQWEYQVGHIWFLEKRRKRTHAMLMSEFQREWVHLACHQICWNKYQNVDTMI